MRERAADVCGLYLSPPENAAVLSVEEKTDIQAKSRKDPTQPVRSGQPAYREFEYIRHGTDSLIAAMDAATGKVMATDIERNNSVTFIALLEETDKSIDVHLASHIVMDNGSSYISKATKRWLAEHPRFVVQHTPAHASWLNQVEAFFSTLTRKLLRRGEFDSRQDLVDKMLAFIDHHGTMAEPFKWSYDTKGVAA